MKKIHNYITPFSVLMLLVVTGTGCLKDKLTDDGLVGVEIDRSAKLIEIAGPVSNIGVYASSNAVNLPFSNNDTTVTVATVRLAADQPASEDIQVTLDTSRTLVEKYADTTHTGYRVPPSSIYTLPNGLSITIPKGSREGYLPIKLKSADLVGHEYALAFTIKSVSKPNYKISGNFNNQVVIVGVKNKYDAIYQLKGYHNRPTLDYPYDAEVSMITVNSNSVAFYWNEAHSLGHPIGQGPGNDLSWYGAAISPVVTFDPTTDLVTNVYNQGGATPITMFTGTGAGVSKFDPATRTMYVYWNYNNNPQRAFFDTLTFVRER